VAVPFTHVVTLDGATLTPEAVAAIARGGARVELAPEARERNDAARRALDTLLARGEQIYGATSGVGALREHHVEADEREQ
jgi:histidine ammonia-lyase